MLPITIPATEQWDEVHERFIYKKEQTLILEHSLVSVSKWESKWHKAFLSNEHKTDEETIDYIRCMTLTQNVDSEVYERITTDNINKVKQYIDDPMTASKAGGIDSNENTKKKSNNSRITSELIYYWMITLNIPFECQKWHLNRLLTLIRICNSKNKPPKKQNQRQLAKRYSEINAANRKLLNSKG